MIVHEPPFITESERTERSQSTEALEFVIIMESMNVCTRRDPTLDEFALKLITGQATETALAIRLLELARW